jgi:hypothetical protein
MRPKTHILDITANNDVPFRLKLTVDDTPGLTKITFYDRRGDKTDNGDVICVMYAESLLYRPHWMGLQLVAPVDTKARMLYIDGPTAWSINDWLNRQIDQGVWFTE